MTFHGQRQVDAAKADGQWDAAYAPVREATQATIPADLRAAIEANPRARQTFRGLGKMSLFALAGVGGFSGVCSGVLTAPTSADPSASPAT